MFVSALTSSASSRNIWTFFQSILCACAISLNVNQSITLGWAFKTKYLWKWQYSNHRFSKFTDTFKFKKFKFMLWSLYIHGCQLFGGRSLLLKLIIVRQLSLVQLQKQVFKVFSGPRIWEKKVISMEFFSYLACFHKKNWQKYNLHP